MPSSESHPPSPITELEIATQQIEIAFLEENADVLPALEPALCDTETSIKFGEYLDALVFRGEIRDDEA